MKIKNLNIISYGKLKDTYLEFSPRLNIVFGANESGKSTSLSFIFDILFGGTLPDSKIARYTKEHENYKPWFGGRFEGSMDVDHCGNTYYLYRNFMKDNENFIIKNKANGEDSKEVFKVDESRKVQVIDQEFFSMTERNLKNTFIINSNEDKEIAFGSDLADVMLGEVQTSLRGLSLSKIIDNIDNLYFNKDLKQEKNALKKSIKDLEDKLKYSFDTFDYEKNLMELESLSTKIEQLDEEIEKEKSHTRSKDIIKNPQYMESLIYQNEKISVEIEDLEDEYREKLNKLTNFYRIRPFIYIFIGFIVLISIYFKKYFLFFSIIIVVINELFIRNFTGQVDLLKEELKVSYSNLDNILEKISKFENDSLEDANPEIKIKQDQLEEYKYEKERVLERLRILDKAKATHLSLKEELENKENRLKEIEFSQSMVDKSKEIILSLAEDNLTNISEEMLNIASSNIDYISQGKYSRLLISDDGNLSLYDNKEKFFVDLEDLSRATMEQVYFSYKLALAASVDIDFPMLIDDGFIFYDDSRKKRSLNLIGQYSKRRQIIYFTSNSEDVDYLNNHWEGKIINL